jgi:plastocyanin
VIATDITAFHIIGAALAIWAVLLAALGILNHNFPPKGMEKVVMGISAILVIAAITTAVTTTPGEKAKGGGEQGGSKQAGGPEGTAPPPAGSGQSAPGTGANNGQATPGEGSAKKPPASAASQTLTLSAAASGQLAFSTKALSGKAGNIKIVMHNPAPVPHNISLQGPNGVNLHGPTVNQNGDSQVQANLKPGKYTFYCSVPGHRQAGMVGTLTVAK